MLINEMGDDPPYSACGRKGSARSKLGTLSSYVDRITEHDQKRWKVKAAKFFYSQNISFRSMDSFEFEDMITDLRADIKIPNRHALAGNILDDTYEKEIEANRDLIKGFKKGLQIDGWKNGSSNNKILSALMQVGHYYILLKAFTTASETGSLMAKLVREARAIAIEKYGNVWDVVLTDNASNMVRMGQIVSAQIPDDDDDNDSDEDEELDEEEEYNGQDLDDFDGEEELEELWDLSTEEP